MSAAPTLAVWKFASCDGCQLSILDCEDELLTLADRIRIAQFPEASRAVVTGPYDISLVEGSVTTPGDAERIRRIRAESGLLIAIGACATAGGIQALRNFADVAEFRSLVYARPEYLSTLDTSTPVSAHVTVDLELSGCPIDRRQLLDTLAALLVGRRPDLPGHSVCFDCKARGTTCVLVARGVPCLGPVTRAGCGAICPAYGRGCYGCFGPAAPAAQLAGAAPEQRSTVNTPALVRRLRELGLDEPELTRVFRTFTAAAPAFAAASSRRRVAPRSGASRRSTVDGGT